MYSSFSKSRFKSADKQIKIIKSLINDSHKNLIVVGDLNMTSISRRFINFLDETNLYTYTSFKNPTFTWPAYIPAFLGIQIDHVLYSKNIKMISKKISKNMGSDHRALIVDLAF